MSNHVCVFLGADLLVLVFILFRHSEPRPVFTGFGFRNALFHTIDSPYAPFDRFMFVPVSRITLSRGLSGNK